jgi:copper transporter 1
MAMMHPMAFHFGVDAKILFEGWHIRTAGGMVGSCVAIITIAALYEIVKTMKEVHLRRSVRIPRFTTNQWVNSSGDPEAASVGEKSPLFGNWSRKSSLSWSAHLLQTLIYFVQITLAYSLMIVFMTLNVWLCISLLFGLTLGYLLFAKLRFLSDTEECH